MLNDATGDAFKARRPSPREEAAYSLHLAAHDPSTDISVACDVLRDVLSACGGGDWTAWAESHAVFLTLGDDAYGVSFGSVCEVLLVCERILLADCVNEYVVRDAIAYAESVA